MSFILSSRPEYESIIKDMTNVYADKLIRSLKSGNKIDIMVGNIIKCAITELTLESQKILREKKITSGNVSTTIQLSDTYSRIQAAFRKGVSEKELNEYVMWDSNGCYFGGESFIEGYSFQLKSD